MVIARSTANSGVADTSIVYVGDPVVQYENQLSTIRSQAELNMFYGPSYFFNESNVIDGRPLSGDASLDLGGDLVGEGISRGRAHAVSSVAFSMATRPDVTMLAGFASGAANSSTTLDNASGYALAHTTSEHVLRFETTAGLKMRLIFTGTVGGTCPNVGIIFIALKRGTTTVFTQRGSALSIDQDIDLLASSSYNLTVSAACQTNNYDERLGTQAGTATYTLAYAFH